MNMATNSEGDCPNRRESLYGPNQPRHMTFSKSWLPFVGALVDYVSTSLQCVVRKTFTHAEKLHPKSTRSTLSATFLAAVCLLLGFTSNIKFEVVTVNQAPLSNDLHFLLLSKDDMLYIDDIDVSRVLWCVEASDLLVLLISCLLVWNSSNVRSPLSEYLFLPWLGVSLRGLLLRQAPTAGALIYTMAVIDGNINSLFLTAFSFLFFLETRLWLEIARVVRSRWERRDHGVAAHNSQYELETLWSNDDVHSVEPWLEIARVERARWERLDHGGFPRLLVRVGDPLEKR